MDEQTQQIEITPSADGLPALVFGSSEYTPSSKSVSKLVESVKPKFNPSYKERATRQPRVAREPRVRMARQSRVRIDMTQYLNIRENTYDEWIAHEIPRVYGSMDIENRIVLDLGGCTGAFAIYASLRGAAHVSTVEPMPENYLAMLDNFARNPQVQNITAYNMAVSKEDGPLTMFYFKGKNNGRHSVVPNNKKVSIEVDGCSLKSFLDVLKPQTVKVDIEGYELILLDGFIFPDYVTCVGMELHRYKGFENWRSIHDQMIAQGFTPSREPRELRNNDAMVIIYKRS